MASHELKVESRDTVGKGSAKKIRRQGMVPAVAYGHKEEPVLLSVNAREIGYLLTHGAAHSLLILKQEGKPDSSVVIKSLQRHPAKHYLNSVDFIRVSLDEEIEATVPIVLDGEPDSVRVEGGVLVQSLHEIVIKARPQNLPENIHVDVTGLVFNGAPIHVREINFPQGIVPVTDGEEPVAVVNPPTVEAEEPSATDEDTAADEVPAEHGADADGPQSENENESLS